MNWHSERPRGEKSNMQEAAHELTALLDDRGLQEPGMREAAGVVEMLARLRTALDEKIGDEKLPVDQWWPACQALLAEHPEAIAYTEIFRRSVMESKRAYELVNKKWERAQRDAGIKSKERGAPTGSQADERTARSLYRLSFGQNPQGRVIADKGRTAIYFHLEEADYEQAYAGSGPGAEQRREESRKTLAKLIFEEPIPHVVILRGGLTAGGLLSIPQPEILTMLKHEREHSFNNQIVAGRGVALEFFRYGHGDLPSAIGRRLDAWDRESLPMEVVAKDEILAKSAELEARVELSELSKSKGAESLFDPEEFLERERADLGHPGGFYHNRYVNRFAPSATEYDRYILSIDKAIDVYKKLRTLYSAETTPSSPDRMARYVLEQFPLHRWTTVARLLERHHREKAIEGAE